MTTNDLDIDHLFREHSDALFRYLAGFRLSGDETYDLVQNAFLKLLTQNRKTIENPKAWLFKVGRNLALNVLRGERRLVGDVNEEQHASDAPDALQRMLSDERNSALWASFQQLSESERELFRLHLEHGLSYKEVANIVGKSGVSVRVSIHRSREKMRRFMSQQDQSDSDPVQPVLKREA